MNRFKWFLVLVLSIFSLAQSVYAADADLGEKLVRKLWKNMKEGNISNIEKQIAAGFQSIHQDGARGRDEEVEMIKGLDLGEYALDDFKVTQAGPVIMVTYSVSVEETIADKRLPKRSSMRMSSFLETNKGWKWISHANLNPLKNVPFHG